jgi:hypothetical protein
MWVLILLLVILGWYAVCWACNYLIDDATTVRPRKTGDPS